MLCVVDIWKLGSMRIGIMLKQLLLFFLATAAWAQVAPATPPTFTGMGCATLILAINATDLCTVQMSGPVAADKTAQIYATYSGSTYSVMLTIQANPTSIAVSIPASLSAWSTDAAHPVSGGTLQVAIPGGQTSATFTVAANGN